MSSCLEFGQVVYLNPRSMSEHDYSFCVYQEFNYWPILICIPNVVSEFMVLNTIYTLYCYRFCHRYIQFCLYNKSDITDFGYYKPLLDTGFWDFKPCCILSTNHSTDQMCKIEASKGWMGDYSYWTWCILHTPFHTTRSSIPPTKIDCRCWTLDKLLR